MIYDFSGSLRPPSSQFYYPSQPTLYHPSHSPLLSPHITVHMPPIVGDHKRDVQVRLFLSFTFLLVKHIISNRFTHMGHGYRWVRGADLPSSTATFSFFKLFLARSSTSVIAPSLLSSR